MKRGHYSLGLLLTFAGLLILLLNLKIITFNILLFLLSIGLIIMYFVQDYIGYIAWGLFILAISSISLINEYLFPNINIRGFLFLLLVSIVFLTLYIRQNKKAYLLTSLLSLALGIYSLVEELSLANVSWVLFLLLGMSLYVAYIVEYNKTGALWPKYLAVIFLFISAVLFLLFGISVRLNFWKFISYLLSMVLIGIGIRIVYNVVRLRRQ